MKNFYDFRVIAHIKGLFSGFSGFLGSHIPISGFSGFSGFSGSARHPVYGTKAEIQLVSAVHVARGAQ